MKCKYNEVKLKAVADVFTGYPFKSKKYQENGNYKVLRGKNIKEYKINWDAGAKYWDNAEKLEEYLLAEGDVVIGMDGSKIGQNFGVIHDEDIPSLLAQRVARVRAKEGISQDYLRYVICNPSFTKYVNAVKTGSSIPHISKTQIEDYKITIPSEKEVQKLIAEKLIVLDRKIRINQQLNKSLESIAKATFKSWFIDFDPVHAKNNAIEEGFDPEHAAMAAISGISLEKDWGAIDAALNKKLSRMTDEQQNELSKTAALFPCEQEDSKMGQIPKGWEICTLEDLITLSYGKGLPKRERKDGQVPVYGSGGLTGTHNQSLIEGPGLIVGRKGTVGSIYWEYEDFWPIDTVFYVEPKDEMKLSFCYYLLQTLGLENMNTDAAVPGLNRNNAYRLNLPKFPNQLIERFDDFTSDIHEMMKNNLYEIKTLEKLRDTLIPKLISGDLEV